jgi:hypothetical protein
VTDVREDRLDRPVSPRREAMAFAWFIAAFVVLAVVNIAVAVALAARRRRRWRAEGRDLGQAQAEWMETSFGPRVARIAVLYLGMNFAMVLVIFVLAAFSH